MIISDNNIAPFKILKKNLKKRGLKIIDVNSEILKVNNLLPTFPIFKIKNLAMAILAAKICGINENLIYRKLKKIKKMLMEDLSL